MTDGDKKLKTAEEIFIKNLFLRCKTENGAFIVTVIDTLEWKY